MINFEQMVDRYTLTASAEELKTYFELDSTDGYTPFFNGAPTKTLPVIMQGTPSMMHFYIWGLMAKWSNNKAMSSKLFNIRLTDLMTKRSYLNNVTKRRCVIMADGFYLWKPIAKRKMVPYYFYPENKGCFGLAGIWEEADEFSDDSTPNFMMITTPSDGNFSAYQENMPMVLDREGMQKWLDKDLEISSIPKLVNPPHIAFLSHAVSPLIAKKEVDKKDLINPAKPADQFGNYTLFG